MCGEKSFSSEEPCQQWGSPPHVRGKEALEVDELAGSGITPACAGKSILGGDLRSATGDHPRMCGEKVLVCVRVHDIAGSPPHVRGKD